MTDYAAAIEANFDGLVGPTHNYGGLAFGNLASAGHAASVSHPREAALQGLAKMKALHDLGLTQGVLPPHERPHLPTLRSLGFTGSDRAVIEQVSAEAPRLLTKLSSAASMWAANAATVSPSSDTADRGVHFTPANLAGNLHRAIETATTARALAATFPPGDQFVHHEPLPAWLGDEGAANHTRLARSYGDPGVEIFVYGADRTDRAAGGPSRYPARQALEASRAVARLHRLDESRTILARQHPQVIDEGVFHNDVIAVGDRTVLFHHEFAFEDSDALHDDIRAAVDWQPRFIVVPEAAVSVEAAVRTYLFNSQLVEIGGRTALIAPEDVKTDPDVAAYLSSLTGDVIDRVITFDLRQSMQNGGGPACLRLRVVLTENELRMVNPASLMSDALYGRLVDWVERHYREELGSGDLADPALYEESCAALDELTGILEIGSIYEFQR